MNTRRGFDTVNHGWVIPTVVIIALMMWNIALGIMVGVVWLLPIIVAIDLGKSRDRTGWMWGFFLGWLGVLILAIMRPRPHPA